MVVWISLAALAVSTAPDWTDVSDEGEFAFLPGDAPSRRAERLYREAFPRPDESSDEANRVHLDPLGTLAVLVINREDRPTGLSEEDLQFVADVLQPALEIVKVTTGAGSARDTERERFVADIVRPVLQRLDDARASNVDPLPDVESLVRDVLSASGSSNNGPDGEARFAVIPARERIVSDVF